MEILKLIGVLVVIVGLALKLDTLATVEVAGIITGFVAGMSPLDTRLPSKYYEISDVLNFE